MNGEIYNHKELLEELKEIVPDIHDEFTTDSDCEVLLHLFQVLSGNFKFEIFSSFYLLSLRIIRLKNHLNHRFMAESF